MNIVELQNKLIAAARAHAPVDRVPHAFEKRITALLGSRAALDNMVLWVRGFWRAAVSCMAVSLLLGAWMLFSAAATSNNDLSQNFERTLLASVDQTDTAQ